MPTLIQNIATSRGPRQLLFIFIHCYANLTSYGLIFFGTPHGGPGKDWKIVLGKTCVRIVQATPGTPSNDIMEALRKGSLFSDALQSQWRHQLRCYKIVTFYEGIGDVMAFFVEC